MPDHIAAPLWDVHARQWRSIKAPLRPSPDDMCVAQTVLDRWHAVHGRAPRALVLGSTVELAGLRWPERSEVVAVDLSQAMLRGVWCQAPGPLRGRRAIVGQWLEMPVQDACCDIVFGDASLAQLRRADAPALARAIRRVLRDDGVASLRVFTRPVPGETEDAVWADVASGAIADVHTFKLRLLLALARVDGEVRPYDVWRSVLATAVSVERLACQTGWSRDAVTTLDAYRDRRATYWFPTLAEVRAVLGVEFIETDCRWQSYEMGHCCPTLLLTPRRS